MPPVINQEECIGCGECYEACQSDVFHKTDDGEGTEVMYPEECWHCNACVFVCPVEAVSLRIPLPMMVLYHDREASCQT